MDKNTVVIRGSFKGILGDFIMNFLMLILTFTVYSVANKYRLKYYEDYDIKSFFSFVMEFTNIKVIVILFSIFLLFFILLIAAISLVFKIIGLLYETQKVITVDYVAGKILVETFSFPFSKTVEEHKFNDIVNVSISQSLLGRLFSTGDMYIEYLTCSKVDSKLKTLDITYVNGPFRIKPKMI